MKCRQMLVHAFAGKLQSHASFFLFVVLTSLHRGMQYNAVRRSVHPRMCACPSNLLAGIDMDRIG